MRRTFLRAQGELRTCPNVACVSRARSPTRSQKNSLSTALEKRWRGDSRSRASISSGSTTVPSHSRINRNQAHGRKCHAYSRNQVVSSKEWWLCDFVGLPVLLLAVPGTIRMGVRRKIHVERSEVRLAVPQVRWPEIRVGGRCAYAA